MALIDPTSELPEPIVRSVFESNREELRDVLAMVRAPTAPVRFPMRLAQVESFLVGILAQLDRDGGPKDRAALIGAANLSYDSMILAIEATKASLDVPSVPRRRAPSSGETAPPASTGPG